MGLSIELPHYQVWLQLEAGTHLCHPPLCASCTSLPFMGPSSLVGMQANLDQGIVAHLTPVHWTHTFGGVTKLKLNHQAVPGSHRQGQQLPTAVAALLLISGAPHSLVEKKSSYITWPPVTYRCPPAQPSVLACSMAKFGASCASVPGFLWMGGHM